MRYSYLSRANSSLGIFWAGIHHILGRRGSSFLPCLLQLTFGPAVVCFFTEIAPPLSAHSPISIKFQWAYFPPVHPLRAWGYLLLIVLIIFSSVHLFVAHKLEKQLYRQPKNCSSFPNSLKCCLCLGQAFLKKSLLAFLWLLYQVMHNFFAASFLPPGPSPAYAVVSNTGIPLCFCPLSKLRNDIPSDMKPGTEHSDFTKNLPESTGYYNVCLLETDCKFLVSSILCYFRTVCLAWQAKEVKGCIFQRFQKTFNNRKYIFPDTYSKYLPLF